jgi:hypothetical protein
VLHWLASLPGWLLFPLFLFLGVGITVLFDVVVRRKVAPETKGRASATAGVTLQVVATIYAILIAFVIVDEYTTVRSTQSEISDKAASLTVVFENSRAFSGTGGDEVRKSALTYARSVVDQGLPHLEKEARPDKSTDHAIEAVYDAVHAVEPATESEKVAYAQMLDALDAVTRTREALINGANPAIPAELFWILVMIGLTVMSVATMLDTQHRGSHLFILSALALVIWITLALVVSMDYPFQGIIHVSDSPIREFIQFRAAR